MKYLKHAEDAYREDPNTPETAAGGYKKREEGRSRGGRNGSYPKHYNIAIPIESVSCLTK